MGGVEVGGLDVFQLIKCECFVVGVTCGHLVCVCCRCAPSMMRLDESNFGENWHMIRVRTHRVTEHKVFEYFILVVIFLSSVSLVGSLHGHNTSGSTANMCSKVLHFPK